MDTESLEHLKRLRLIKTSLLPLAYFSFGLIAAIRGLSLIDLRELLDCSIASLTTAMMFMPIGVALGSITGAVLTDQLTSWADLGLTTSSLVLASSIAAVPWSPNLAVMGTLFALAGICQGNINVTCGSLTIRMWGRQAASPLLAIHTFYSLGMLLASPITGPFLSHTIQDTNTSQEALYADASLWNQSDTGSVKQLTRVYIPYGIVGSICALGSCNFVVCHCIGWTFVRLSVLGQADTIKEDDKKDIYQSDPSNDKGENNTFQSLKSIQKQGLTDDSTVQQRPAIAWILRGFMFICYATIMYREMVLCIFLFTVAVKSNLHMSKYEAVRLTTAFYCAFAAGRGASAIYSHFINIHILIFVEVALSLVLCAILTAFGLDGREQLWVLSCFLAVVMSPLNPTILVWTHHYLPASGLTIAFAICGVGVGNCTAFWVGGYVFDYYGSIFIFYLMLGSSVLLAVIMVILQSLAQMYTRSQCGGVSDTDNVDASTEPGTPVHRDREKTPLIH